MGKDIPGDHNPEGSHRSSWDSMFLLGELHPMTLISQPSKAVKPLGFSQPTVRLKLPQNFQTLVETESFPHPPRGQSCTEWAQGGLFPHHSDLMLVSCLNLSPTKGDSASSVAVGRKEESSRHQRCPLGGTQENPPPPGDTGAVSCPTEG